MTHFKTKFKENGINKPTLEGDILKRWSLEDKRSFELPFEEREIKEAVWNCDGSKSPRPDEYSTLFFKRC